MFSVFIERGVEKQVSLEGVSSAEEVEKKIASLIV
jgi:NADH dehydrogenase (ubiquinone) 1 alpha subcomplex subunit 2